MTRTIVCVVFACSLACGVELITHPRFAPALAQDDWKADFEDICAKTQDAMALTKEELGKLVERCDKLKPRIEKLDESAAKVYLRRLQMCRDLYAFVLESKSVKPLP